MAETKPDRAARITEHHDVWAFAALDTIGPLTERIRAIVETGRPMTVIRRWLDLDNTDLAVKAGLRVSTREGGREPISAWTQERAPRGAGFRVDCEPGLESWGFAAHADDEPSEDEVARRYHDKTHLRRRRDLTRITIEGWPTSQTVIVTIEHWNQYGVGMQTVVAFAPLPGAREVAEAQAAVLDTLAGARETWTAEELRATAHEARYEWKPVADVIAAP